MPVRGVLMSMPDGSSGDRFRGLLLQLRGRIGLTQRELAARLDVHAHSVQAWEAGTSYPGAASLRALIAAAMQAGGFTPGNEVAEASALWSAAMQESSRLRTPFDRTWFDTLLRPAPTPERLGVAGGGGAAAGADGRAFEPRRHSWGEAPGSDAGAPGRGGRGRGCRSRRRASLRASSALLG